MLKNFSLVCLLICFSGVLKAQQQDFDKALEFAQNNFLINNDSLLIYADQAIELGLENEFPGTSRAYYFKAVGLFYQAKYREGIEVTRTGLDWTNKYDLTNTIVQGQLYNRLAGNYIMLGLYELGLEQLLIAQDIFELHDDQEQLFMNLNNIGVVWLKLKDYDKALETYEELLTYEQDNPLLLVPIYYNFANIYFDLENYEKALTNIEQSLSLAGEDDQRLSQIYYMRGNILSGLGSFENALNSYTLSIQYYEEQNNELNTVQPKLGIARTLIQQAKLDSAQVEADESLDIALRYESLPDRVEALEVLSMISEEQGDLNEALAYYKSYTELSDSLNNANVNQEIANLLAEQEFEQVERDLLFEQQEQRIRSEAQILRQRIIIAGTIVIIFLVLSIMFIQRNKAKERLMANEMLVRKNEIIEEKARKLDEANSIKNRLFSIIAHDLRNPLSSLQGVIQLIEMKAASKEELDRILPYLTHKFENTSILLANLLEWSMSQMDGYSVKPENFDINELIKERFEVVRSRTDEKELSVILPTNSVIVHADKNMIGIVILNLFSNSIKFTGLHGEIRVTVTDNLDEVIFSISDSGKGIPANRLPYVLDDQFESTKGTRGEKGTGLGLIICKEFIQKNAGNIWIQSEEGHGTTVSFSLPVAIEEEVELKKEEV